MSAFGEAVLGDTTRIAEYATSYAVTGRPFDQRALSRRWNVKVRRSSLISQPVARLGTGRPSMPYVASPSNSDDTSGALAWLDASTGSRWSGSPELHQRNVPGTRLSMRPK